MLEKCKKLTWPVHSHQPGQNHTASSHPATRTAKPRQLLFVSSCPCEMIFPQIASHEEPTQCLKLRRVLLFPDYPALIPVPIHAIRQCKTLAGTLSQKYFILQGLWPHQTSLVLLSGNSCSGQFPSGDVRWGSAGKIDFLPGVSQSPNHYPGVGSDSGKYKLSQSYLRRGLV